MYTDPIQAGDQFEWAPEGSRRKAHCFCEVTEIIAEVPGVEPAKICTVRIDYNGEVLPGEPAWNDDAVFRDSVRLHRKAMDPLGTCD